MAGQIDPYYAVVRRATYYMTEVDIHALISGTERLGRHGRIRGFLKDRIREIREAHNTALRKAGGLVLRKPELETRWTTREGGNGMPKAALTSGESGVARCHAACRGKRLARRLHFQSWMVKPRTSPGGARCLCSLYS